MNDDSGPAERSPKRQKGVNRSKPDVADMSSQEIVERLGNSKAPQQMVELMASLLQAMSQSTACVEVQPIVEKNETSTGPVVATGSPGQD